MKTYTVEIHYEGSWSFEVKAENAEEAERKAEQMFDEIPDRELIANLAEVFVYNSRETDETFGIPSELINATHNIKSQ